MDIQLIANSSIAASTSNADLFTLAVNNVIPMSAQNALVYVNKVANGYALTNEEVAGTSSPTLQCSPSFFPLETKGAECAAVLSAGSLAWADQNLESGYEYMKLVEDTASRTSTYFVSGVLNSDKEEFNKPFEDSDVLHACCWDGEFAIGVNPF